MLTTQEWLLVLVVTAIVFIIPRSRTIADRIGASIAWMFNSIRNR